MNQSAFDWIYLDQCALKEQGCRQSGAAPWFEGASIFDDNAAATSNSRKTPPRNVWVDREAQRQGPVKVPGNAKLTNLCVVTRFPPANAAKDLWVFVLEYRALSYNEGFFHAHSSDPPVNAQMSEGRQKEVLNERSQVSLAK